MDINEFEQIKNRVELNKNKKIRAEERLKAAKQKVSDIVKEINNAGYEDASKLAEALEVKKQELTKKSAEVTSLLDEQEAILAKLDN